MATSEDLNALNNSMNVSVNATINPLCIVWPHPETIIWITVVFGSAVAVISFIENLLIFLTLVQKSKYYRSHFLYLLLLAFWDCCIAATFVLMFPIDVIKDKYNLITLANIWLTYLPVVFTLSQYATTASTMFILAATFERFMIEAHITVAMNFVRRHRVHVCVVVLLFVALLKLPNMLEVKVEKNLGDCGPGLREYVPMKTDLAGNELYKIYSFYLRTIFSDVLPFIFIFLFNFYIAVKLRAMSRHAKLFRVHTKDKFQAQASLAGKMLVVMVMSYLLSKVVNFVLLVWEFLDVESLDALDEFYWYSSHLSNVMMLMGCMSRLPIYLIFNKEIRQVIERDLMRWLFCSGPKPSETPENTLPVPAVSQTNRKKRPARAQLHVNGVAGKNGNSLDEQGCSSLENGKKKKNGIMKHVSRDEPSETDELLMAYPMSTAKFVAMQAKRENKNGTQSDVPGLLLLAMRKPECRQVANCPAERIASSPSCNSENELWKDIPSIDLVDSFHESEQTGGLISVIPAVQHKITAPIVTRL